MRQSLIMSVALIFCACSSNSSSTSTTTPDDGKQRTTNDGKQAAGPTVKLVGKCEARSLPTTAWKPTKEQLRSAFERSEDDIRRFYEGGSVSFAKGKVIEAATKCMESASSTLFDMQVCGAQSTAGDSGAGCYPLNVHSLDWKGRHWIILYYNYGNESLVDIYEVRGGNVEPYCPAFRPQFHNLCNDMAKSTADTRCAKLEADWKSMPEPVQMALCFPGQN